MMDRRIFLMTVAGLLAAPLAAEAQQAGKVYRIGVLTPSANVPLATFDAFRQTLRELGYVEGRNIAIEWRFAEGRYERFPELARELVGIKVDVIVAVIAVAAQAAKEATPTIPVVMVAVHDPVGSGLVASLARPGGNVTGLSFLSVELVAKQLELLKETVPSLSRVAVLRNPASPPHALLVREAERAGRVLGVQLRVLEARGPEDFDAAFSTMTADRADALLVLGDGMFFLHRTRLAELAAKNRLPAMYGSEQHVEVGGLVAYSADLLDNWRRSATYVDRILKGARPADLPVEQPMKFRLVINLKTAKVLGLTIPQSLLLRADQVIE
jgi:putative ABC transport system substrate-binding protein